MPNILDGLGLEGSVLDGLDDWPRSATRKEWFRITRELVASTIADMDLPPHELAQVEERSTSNESCPDAIFSSLSKREA